MSGSLGGAAEFRELEHLAALAAGRAPDFGAPDVDRGCRDRGVPMGAQDCSK